MKTKALAITWLLFSSVGGKKSRDFLEIHLKNEKELLSKEKDDNEVEILNAFKYFEKEIVWFTHIVKYHNINSLFRN